MPAGHPNLIEYERGSVSRFILPASLQELKIGFGFLAEQEIGGKGCLQPKSEAQLRTWLS